jgi:hypothetical protein
MRLLVATVTCVALSLSLSACRGSGEVLGPVTTLTISTAPDFRAIVTKVTFEAADGPGFGFYEQYDIWLVMAPPDLTNAGLVAAKKIPTFVRTSDGLIHASAAEKIQVHDVIQVWRGQAAVFGAVQGPPNAPTYEAKQVVIER